MTQWVAADGRWAAMMRGGASWAIAKRAAACWLARATSPSLRLCVLGSTAGLGLTTAKRRELEIAWLQVQGQAGSLNHYRRRGSRVAVVGSVMPECKVSRRSLSERQPRRQTQHGPRALGGRAPKSAAASWGESRYLAWHTNCTHNQVPI